MVFLTGSTGFIGSRILSDLLSAQHRVRASVRRAEQISLLTSRHSSSVESGQLQFAVIPSLEDAESVKAAVANDVSCIIHLASPMPGKGDDFETGYLHPAVRGTETILEAAKGTKVERVVVMSSVLAMMPLGGLEMEGLHVVGMFSLSLSLSLSLNSTYNPTLSPILTQIPEGANSTITVPSPFTSPSPGAKYTASKILAHRATLAWAARHQSTLNFDIVTIHPSFVLGRDLTFTSSPGEFPPGINGWVIRSLGIPPPGKPLIPALFVDVGDVSTVVLRSVPTTTTTSNINTVTDGNGKGEVTEVLVSGIPTSWEEILEFAKRFPQIENKLQGPFIKPMTVDTTRAETSLGIKWRETGAMLGDVFGQFAQSLESVETEREVGRGNL